jgi:hypothetical protein
LRSMLRQVSPRLILAKVARLICVRVARTNGPRRRRGGRGSLLPQPFTKTW